MAIFNVIAAKESKFEVLFHTSAMNFNSLQGNFSLFTWKPELTSGLQHVAKMFAL